MKKVFEMTRLICLTLCFLLVWVTIPSNAFTKEEKSKLPYVIEPQYHSAEEFNKYGIARVQLAPVEVLSDESVYGVINLKGEKVFGFDGTKFALRKNGLIMAVGENDKAAFFSKDGEQLTEYVYETFKRVQPKTPHFVTYHYVTDFFDGDGESELIPICRDGKFGFINSKGEESIAPTFDYVFGFYEGISRIGYDGVLSEYGTYTQCKFGYINEKGEVLPTGELWEAWDYSNGYARIADGQYKVVDKNGSEVQFPIGSFEFLETNGNFILAGHDGGNVVLDMNGNLLSDWAPNIQLFGKSFIIWQKQIADINGNIIYTAPEGMRIISPVGNGNVARITPDPSTVSEDVLVNQDGEVVLQANDIKEVAEGIFWTPDSTSLFDVNGNKIAEVEGALDIGYRKLSCKLLPILSAETNKWGYVEFPEAANPFISEYTESSVYHVEKIIPTDYGTVLYFWPVGAPHGGKSPHLTLIKDDGSKISLSEPVSREDLWHHPEHENITLSEDGKTLTFSVSFDERSAGSIAGRPIVLHDAGTYYYKADLETGVCIETRFEPHDTMGEDVISAWAKPEIESAINLGFVPITLRENYKRNITRAEFAKMAMYFLSVQYGYQPEHIIRTYYNMDKDFPLEDFISAYCTAKKDRNRNDFIKNTTGEAWKYEDKKVTDPVFEISGTDFSDLNSENIFDMQLIGVAYNFGIINGISETVFNPNGDITRQEAAAMLMRVYKNYAAYQNADTEYLFSDDVEISEWAKEDVYSINDLGVMRGVGGDIFAPLEGYTVEQAIATFLRLYESAPVSRKNKNIEPLLDFEYEKENFYVNIPGTSSFFPEKEYEFSAYTVVSGTCQRYHRRPDHKLYVFYKYGGKRDLTSFVPVAQDNTSLIENININADENVIRFVTEIADTFCLYNKLNGMKKVYPAGEYMFECDIETGNILLLERIK
ncbi:MAG: hypothetical protein E7408_02675 [Ruminococcaceae bacterium]|nr:hypothetical protein [Oscillospiraceae bacterium]